LLADQVATDRFIEQTVQVPVVPVAVELEQALVGEIFNTRRLVLPKKIENWSLTSLQQRLVKTGGRLVKHAWYYWLMLAESHLTRRLFGSMVRRIGALAVATG
jgi:hypothetical protein